MTNLKTFIFIGPSGCGKGTQVELLVDHYTKNGDFSPEHPVLHSESGKRFRDFVTQDNFLAQEAKKALNRGERLPDSLAVWNWTGYLIENYTGSENLIFDGSPRSLLEAQSLNLMLKFLGRDKVVVIYLEVSPEESLKRLLKRAGEQGRADDNPEEIKRRLSWFEKDVRPALEFYQNEPGYVFLPINGEQSREKIHEDIMASIQTAGI